VSRSGGQQWAELLEELRLLRRLVERQNELLAGLLEMQNRIREEIMRAGLG
jgi:hypothetical protein